MTNKQHDAYIDGYNAFFGAVSYLNIDRDAEYNKWWDKGWNAACTESRVGDDSNDLEDGDD